MPRCWLAAPPTRPSGRHERAEILQRDSTASYVRDRIRLDPMEGLRRRRAEILGVARKRRARRIAVFGSVARGEAHPDSDVDLLVDFEPGASLLDHTGLFQDLEDLLGVGVDVVARSALKTRDDHIRAEAVDL